MLRPNPHTRRRSNWRRAAIKVALFLLLTSALALFYHLNREEPPRPTQAGWRARVLTVAGDGAPGHADGHDALSARFAEPFGIALDRDGNLYVSDAGESNRIRKITKEGAVVTLAGGGEGRSDGSGASASFHTPSAIATDYEGNLYVADTGNSLIRKVTPEGQVTTLAGDGTPGHADGHAASARFNAPVGIALDGEGNLYVADTYNDRIRRITPDGQVETIAGAGSPGYADGEAQAALFDTPTAIAVAPEGELFIADTGNDRIRKLTRDRQVTTLPVVVEGGSLPGEVSRPSALALTHDGFLYVAELNRGRVLQISPDMTARPLAGRGSGFADGDGLAEARFNQPTGIALDPGGSLYVADSANYIVRRVAPAAGVDESEAKSAWKFWSREEPSRRAAVALSGPLPRLSPESEGSSPFLWPLSPQDSRHEVAATMGEVRGSFDSDDSRHHLHSGIDVFGLYGQTVRAVRKEKISSPLANWGFGGLNEGLRVGLVSYIHIRVGRDEEDRMLEGSPFIPVRGSDGKLARVRVRRGTRFSVGDPLGTVNRMYHVHMNYGPPGAEMNPLMLPLAGFTDGVRPTIERDGVQLFDAKGERITEKRDGRLLLSGPVRIVVDAYDQVDGNQARRRLGLYRLGFQLLRPDGSPAPGFERPRVQIEFDRLPPDREATKIAYADASGITVYGSQSTRFLYELTNTVRAGRAERGAWNASELPSGDYTLRIIAEDLAGNAAEAGRDLPIRIE